MEFLTERVVLAEKQLNLSPEAKLLDATAHSNFLLVYNDCSNGRAQPVCFRHLETPEDSSIFESLKIEK